MFKKYILPILILLALVALGYLIYYKTNEYKPKEHSYLFIEGENGSTFFLTAVAQKNHIIKIYDKYLVAELFADSCNTVIRDTIDYILTYPDIYKYSQTFFEIASGHSLFSASTYTYTPQGVYLPIDAHFALYSEYISHNQSLEYASELQLKLTNRFSLWLKINPSPPHEMFIMMDGKPFEKVSDISSTYIWYLSLQDAIKFFDKYP